MNLAVLQAGEARATTRLASPDQALNATHFRNIRRTGIFCIQEMNNFIVERSGGFIQGTLTGFKFAHKFCIPQRIKIMHGNVAGCLIGYMHFMPLVDQALKGAAHRDHIVIGVRTEEDDPFFSGFSAFGAVGIVRIRFAAWPTGDGALQSVEYLDIEFVGVGLFDN